MNDSPNGRNDEMPGIEELSDLSEAVRAGFRRASMHWMRAGYEVVAGLSAFLDEIAEAGKEGDDDTSVDPGPTKIELD